MTTPLIGTIVRYTLDEYDVTAINHRRQAAVRSHPFGDIETWTHIGNWVNAGDISPAIVVYVSGEDNTVDLQVFLDGNDTHWATSRHEGVRPGEWSVR